MIEKLVELMPRVLDATRRTTGWGSLIINRRKPHTYRVFQQFDEYRICLHKFEECDGSEAFMHPHPWPGAFILLRGAYVHRIGTSADLQRPPTLFYQEVLRPYSMYELVDPHIWHAVQPLFTTWTVMCNGTPWKTAHAAVRTTKGKDLKELAPDKLVAHLHDFHEELNRLVNTVYWQDLVHMIKKEPDAPKEEDPTGRAEVATMDADREKDEHAPRSNGSPPTATS